MRAAPRNAIPTERCGHGIDLPGERCDACDGISILEQSIASQVRQIHATEYQLDGMRRTLERAKRRLSRAKAMRRRKP